MGAVVVPTTDAVRMIAMLSTVSPACHRLACTTHTNDSVACRHDEAYDGTIKQGTASLYQHLSLCDVWVAVRRQRADTMHSWRRRCSCRRRWGSWAASGRSHECAAPSTAGAILMLAEPETVISQPSRSAVRPAGSEPRSVSWAQLLMRASGQRFWRLALPDRWRAAACHCCWCWSASAWPARASARSPLNPLPSRTRSCSPPLVSAAGFSVKCAQQQSQPMQCIRS